MSNKNTFHFEETGTGVRRIGARIGEAVAEILLGHATLVPADVSPRRGRKEDDQWRSERRASASSDPIHAPEDGDSSWWAQEAKKLVRTMRASSRDDVHLVRHRILLCPVHDGLCVHARVSGCNLKSRR